MVGCYRVYSVTGQVHGATQTGKEACKSDNVLMKTNKSNLTFALFILVFIKVFYA